jgi:hypothetical protein
MMTLHRIAVALALVAALAAPARAQSQIESIDGSAALVGVRSVSVPPVERSQTASLVDAGTIETDGYSTIVLNFAGRLASESNVKSGAVGAILVPDVDPFDKAYRTFGLLPASIEIAAQADGATATFMAKQVNFAVGFPRYRVLFYNSTNYAATVHFFAYRHRN